jgi:hypothetical protein
MPQQASLYRMVMYKHVCPYGIQAMDLLRREGFTVDDHGIRSHVLASAKCSVKP